MIAVITLFATIVLSLLVTRIASVALSLTGLSSEASQFQARSAFTGVGFTTTEAESIVSHPLRRRIVMMLMLMGNAGIVAVITALSVSFVGQQSMSAPLRMGMLFGGLLALWLTFRMRWVDRVLARVIEWGLRRFTRLDAHDYASLLHLADGYRVVEVVAKELDWISGRSVRELAERESPILVLGIKRTGVPWSGAPAPGEIVQASDTAVLYGSSPELNHACAECPLKVAALRDAAS